jgi:hypothetical protein
MATESKPMKPAGKKIVLEKARAGEIIAALKILETDVRRAKAAVVSAKRILTRSSSPAKGPAGAGSTDSVKGRSRAK